jgi:hypothetical protein
MEFLLAQSLPLMPGRALRQQNPCGIAAKKKCSFIKNKSIKKQAAPARRGGASLRQQNLSGIATKQNSLFIKIIDIEGFL